MEWFKMSASFDLDGALIRAGEAAEVLFNRGLAHCTREETEGFIQDGIPERLCPKGTKARVRALVAAELWIRNEPRGGWVVRSWGKWQGELDALAARRRADRERKRRQRDRQAGSATLSRDGHADMSRDKPAMSQDCPQTPRAGDREQRPKTVEKSASQGHHQANGRNVREDREPPNNDPPGPREQILTRWLGTQRNPVQGAIVQAVGAIVDDALSSGLTQAQVQEGVDLWQARIGEGKKIGPGVLPSVIHEVTQRDPVGSDIAVLPTGLVLGAFRPNVDPRPSTSDQRFNAAMALSADLERLERQEASHDAV